MTCFGPSMGHFQVVHFFSFTGQTTQLAMLCYRSQRDVEVQYAPSQTSELQHPYIIFHRPNSTPLRVMNQ